MSNIAPDGPIPEEQQPGRQPTHQADKPDMDAFAERLGVVKDGDEPDGAPSVTADEPASPTIAHIRSRQRTVAMVVTVVAIGLTIAGVRRLRRR